MTGSTESTSSPSPSWLSSFFPQHLTVLFVIAHA